MRIKCLSARCVFNIFILTYFYFLSIYHKDFFNEHKTAFQQNSLYVKKNYENVIKKSYYYKSICNFLRPEKFHNRSILLMAKNSSFFVCNPSINNFWIILNLKVGVLLLKICDCLAVQKAH